MIIDTICKGDELDIEGMMNTFDDSVKGLSDAEKVCECIRLSRQYEQVEKLLRKKANDLADQTNNNFFYSQATGVKVYKKTRVTYKVNQELLRMSYSQVYGELSAQGKLVAKAEDLKKYSNIEGVLVPVTTTYLA